MNHDKTVSISDVYGFLIDRTSKIIKRNLQKYFRNHGYNITVDQWVIMNKLMETNGLNQFELADSTLKDRPTVTKILDLLVDKKIVERKLDPDDRRRFKIFLTEKGRTMMQTLIPKVKEFRKIGWKELNDEDFQHLKRVLNIVYKNFENHKF